MSLKNNTKQTNEGETLEITVGTKISFDKVQYDHAVGTIERAIIPAMAKVVTTYKALNIGTFEQEIWGQVITNNLEKVKSSYIAMVTMQANELVPAIASMLMDEKVIEGSFGPFRKEVENLHSAFSMTQQVITNAPKITLSDCLVNDAGEPVLDKASLEARFTVAVSNEAQIALLKLMGELKEKYDNVRGFLKARPEWEWFTILTDRPGMESLSFEGDEGLLEIDHKIVSLLND